jgi:hypothetical protein
MLKALLVTALAIASVSSRAEAPIRVMLLDGESGGPYHKWQLTSLVLQKQLVEAGLFDVDLVSAPAAGELQRLQAGLHEARERSCSTTMRPTSDGPPT